MKKILAGLTCVGAAVALLAFTAPQSHATTPVVREPAAVISDFLCGMFDGDGGFVITDASHNVQTGGGKDNMWCKATVTPPSSGRAAHFGPFECGTPGGITLNGTETVSASGEATLKCKI